MSLAAETRAAVAEHPFLEAALRAGVCNYTAAARFLDVDGDVDAVATALRRYADDLPAYETASRTATVRMKRGIGPLEGDGELLAVGGTGYGESDDDLTAVLATGDVDADALGVAIRSLALADVAATAVGVAGDALVLVVDRRDGATALRAVEDALDRVPER